MQHDADSSSEINPRLILLRDAPFYLGMDKNRFNAEVRPYVVEIRVGKQGVAFDRIDLDAWVDQYKARNGRPGQARGDQLWDATKRPGLIKRGGIWHIDKQVRGRRLCESTGTSDLREAETYLARRIEESRQASIYGVRPKRSFRQAATRYLNEARKSSIRDAALQLRLLDPYIGDCALEAIHMGALQVFIADRTKQGVKNRTTNYALQTVRHILNLAASEWLDEHGLTWLASAPKIKLLPQTDSRQPYPLSWEEQRRLFKELPPHLARMALFKVNTGCREQEVCRLRWEWEIAVPELDTSVFLIPAHAVKNREERLVLLNRIARSVVEEVRGQHTEFVFTYRGHRITAMNNSAWQAARKRVGLPRVRVHDLVIRSGAGCGLQVWDLKTGRICWDTSLGG